MLLFVGILMLIVVGVQSDRYEIEAVLMQYVNLASAVQDCFQSSSVFIVNADFYEDLSETVLMAKMSREFSSKYVFSQNINFTKLHQEVEYYNDKTVQPLFVVILKTLDDIHEFTKTTRLYNMGLHAWLVIFMKSKVWTFNDYCHRPQDNLFNLVVSSRMLVKCYNDPVLKEWYSVDEKTVDTFDYGSWSEEEKRMITFAQSNFYERRSNFKGARLKVSAVTDLMPVPGWKSTMDGFFGIVLKELAQLMNFTIDFDSIEPTYGNYNTSTQRWSGVIGRLVNHEIDIGIGELTITRQRTAVIDFTVPLMLTFSDIYIKRPDMSNVDWSAYIKAFHKDIWLIIIAILIVSPILLNFMWRVIKGHEFGRHLAEEYLRVWGIYCQKPLTDFPTSSSLRLAYISMFMSSLVLFAVYSAYLTSYLTLFKPSLPFNTFEGFVRDGTYKLIVIRHSSNYDLFKRKEASIFHDMGKLLKSERELPIELFAAAKQVCDERVVFFTNQLMIEKISHYSPCKLMSLTQGRLDNVGLALVKDSPYMEIFNYNLRNLRAFGIIERLKHLYYKKFVTEKLAYLPVAFTEIIPVLGILSLGIVISLKVAMCECIFHKRNYAVGSIKTKSTLIKTAMLKVLVNTKMLTRLICILLVDFSYAKAMSYEQMQNHVLLAAEVKDFYRASSVFNIYNNHSSDMKILPTMLRLSLRFSNNNILVQSMQMSKVHCYLKYYKYRTLLPLYIVILETEMDLHEFTQFAGNFEMSLNLWLVFIYKTKELLKFCAKPDRNRFNLRYDTKMLVKCENDSMVREWYALNDKVKVNDLGTWSVEKGFVKVTNKSLWERRNNLDGITLRIATVKESAFATTELEHHRGTMYGLFGSALRELAEIMNFTVELVAVEDMYGNFESKNGKWSGVMGRLIARDIDIGVAEFGRSNERLEVVDFTVPLLLARMNLYLRQPNMSAIVWLTYVQVFDMRIWTSTLLLVLVCSVVISLMVAWVEKKRVMLAAADNWFYVWGIQCQQGLPEFPVASSLKIAFTSVMIASMVIYSSYSATLTSYLALFTPQLPFTSQKEFLIDNNSYNLTIIRGSLYHDMIERASDANTEKMRKSLVRKLPNSMIEAIDQVCNEKIVLLTNELFVNKMSEQIHCPLVPITLGRLDSVSFTLTKRSQYRGILNFYIENFRSYGIIKLLMNRHLRKMHAKDTKYSPVSFWSIVPLLTIYFSGVGLAIVILMCEYLHYRWWCRSACKRSSIKWKFGKY